MATMTVIVRARVSSGEKARKVSCSFISVDAVVSGETGVQHQFSSIKLYRSTV